MALGNSMSMGQARGKNKPIKIKRRVEEVAAKDYTAFNASPTQPRDACGYSGSFSETFYHNGSSALPAANDTVYKDKRAYSPNRFTAGHYKVDDGRRGLSLEIESNGNVRRVTLC